VSELQGGGSEHQSVKRFLNTNQEISSIGSFLPIVVASLCLTQEEWKIGHTLEKLGGRHQGSNLGLDK
jgi:hypothetical protein